MLGLHLNSEYYFCGYRKIACFWILTYPRVTVVDAFVGHTITTLPADNVFELGFSPFGTYIITWQRSSKDENGDAVKNLKVWKTIDDDAGEGGERKVVGQFVQRNQTGWNLQYTSDEKYAARLVTNEVQFYESGDLKTVWNKLRAEGVMDFAIAPGKTHSVAVFVPERKVGADAILENEEELTDLGPTRRSESLCRSSIRVAGFTEDFLQRRQGGVQVERSWNQLDCAGEY